MPTLFLRRLAALALCGGLAAQAAPPSAHWEYRSIRTGVLANPYPVEVVVFRRIVALPRGIPWMRLFFSEAILGKGSYLRISSLADGDVMTMRKEHLEQWEFTSGYFNGNVVLLELVAGPRTGKNLLEIEKIRAGDDPASVPGTDTLCGAADTRVPSSDPRVGRLDNGCTAFLVDRPSTGNDRLHLSAGHCFSGATVLEFQVPASRADCSPMHPPTSLQFAIDFSSTIWSNGGPGNDYLVFRCFPNPNTGLTTFQQQGSAFSLSASIPGSGAPLQVLGYGIDGSDSTPGPATSCACSPAAGTGSRNRVLQIANGSLLSAQGSEIRHSADTCGGSSGSPVVLANTQEVLAIHTHGGCTTASGGSNRATSVTDPALANAIRLLSGGASSNDECAGAVMVTDGVRRGLSNASATLSAPAWPCGAGGSDVWFAYTATCSGPVTVDACGTGTNFDTVLEVFSGTCGNLVSLGCSDDFCGLSSSVTFQAAAATTYYLRVGGFGGSTGTFDLSVSGCSAADECSGAIPLRLGNNGLFSNRLATTSPEPWPCGPASGNDLWFSFRVDTPAVVSFDTCSVATTFDTVAELFSGACGQISSLDCNDDVGAAGCSGSASASRVTAPVSGPETLFLRIGGSGGALGAFDVRVEQTPPNDDCSAPIAVTDGVNGPFSNLGATSSARPWPCGTGASADVWFSYTATCAGTLTVDTCSSARTFDTRIEILSGTCQTASSLGCNDDACGTGSSLSVPVAPGQALWIRVGGYDGSQGLFELNVSCAPANDDCGGAIPLVEGANGPFGNSGASSSAPAWPCGAIGSDVWFSYTAQFTAPVTFRTCSPSRTFDTAIEVFLGSCGALQSLACDDDSCGTGSSATVNLTQGQVCLIRVGGVQSAQGAFELLVELGTGNGSLGTLPTGCGAVSIAYSGEPHIHGSLSIQIQNAQSVPVLVFGFLQNPTPLCPPQPCSLGLSAVSSLFGGSIAIPIPVNPGLIGQSFAFQGADLFAPGGCSTFVTTVTDTLVLVIG
ncbi:MAG: hypothetical protein Fur0037_09700 [Planctomycetota bacterium]